jgi:hypothetical protein
MKLFSYTVNLCDHSLTTKTAVQKCKSWSSKIMEHVKVQKTHYFFTVGRSCATSPALLPANTGKAST